ncbi:pyruvate kinase, partial [candidate division KSB1 bacterium]|nr:pyruvate kinase [candidate division KSB1 bacterium]
MRRTKIVCTIGPVSDSEEVLGKLMDAGMNVARLNFSHGTHEQHQTVLERIRKVAAEKDKPIAILQDLAGPKIRIRDFKDGFINLTPGETFTLTTEDIAGDKLRVSVTYPKLPNEVKAGDRILLADGSIQLQVKKTDSRNVVCEVVVGGELSSKKGINLPGSSLSVEALTAKDREDLKFGLEHNVDYVAMSFVRRQEDIQQITKIMKENKKPVPIIAKIEKHEAIENIDDILKVVDGIMVARGDLAV